MEKSIIYNLLDDKLLHKWRDEINEREKDSFYSQAEKDTLKELTEALSEKSVKLLTLYAVAIENRLDDLYYNINIKMLNHGIKIGMQLQKAFIDNEE